MALVLRGDHELNAVKAQKLPGIAQPLRMASAAEIQAASGAPPGFIGPRELSGMAIWADHAALAAVDFVCGANEIDWHLKGVNWGRDLPTPPAADLRNVVAGDPSPSGHGSLRIVRGIEVGHIFQLGRKYSSKLGATVLDEAGKSTTLLMGCYGIGVTRIVAAAIEQNHDERGILCPTRLHHSMWYSFRSICRSRRVCAKSPTSSTASSRIRASKSSTTIATSDPASSSPMPSCSVSAIASSSPSADLRRARLNIASVAPPDNEQIPRESVVGFLRERLHR